MKKILIIQTAFIGDVVLATAIIEKLGQFFNDSQIDFLLRKGNESLLENNPHLNQILIWDKKRDKYKNLFTLLKSVRKEKYDLVINLQRFFSTGFFTLSSKGKETVGYDKNPFSYFFSKRIPHRFGTLENPIHEVERNLALVELYTDNQFVKPKLHPSEKDFNKIKTKEDYICIAPTSVWFTKQLPAKKWVELINNLDKDLKIFLLGGKGDKTACEAISKNSNHPNIQILAGKLSFLESGALMKNALMNYVNDSAPLHFASALNARVTAIFCSTIPAFGFTPLSSHSKIIEVEEKLSCRPCGLHGKSTCPQGHFKCSEVEIKNMLPD